MSKAAEQNYLSLIGDAGREHSRGKPFTDELCDINLASIAAVMALLPPPPARVLDMGCGGGWTSIFLARRGYQVVGQDISADMIALAEEGRAAEKAETAARLSFRTSDFEGSPFEGEFDAVLFFDCLHHAEDERAALQSAFRALKPGGILLCHEPGEGHSVTPGSIAAMEQFGVSERDMPPHLIWDQGREVGFRSFRIFPMQEELLKIFYRQDVPPLLSRKGLLRARRVLRAAFRPSPRDSAITVLQK